MSTLPGRELAEKLAKVLSDKGMKISAAESCTGGLIGATITALPGSSDYFLGSAVTYSNDAKENILKVPRGVLFAYGAVSEQTAKCMARGCVSVYGSDAAVAVTGIAGPGGGTDTKPVGLVYIAVSDGKDTVARKCNFTGSRDEVRAQTVETALTMLIEFTEAH